MEKELTVLRIRPGVKPEVIKLDSSLESLQKEVDGPIDIIEYELRKSPGTYIDIILNDEGKMRSDLLFNRTIYFNNRPVDVIVGTFLCSASDAEGNTISLSKEQVAQVEKEFDSPEYFIVAGDTVVMFKEDNYKDYERICSIDTSQLQNEQDLFDAYCK